MQSFKAVLTCLCLSGLLRIGMLVQAQPLRQSKADDLPLEFEQISTEQGLSSHFVMSLLQDRKGYLWFGTGTGLDKYDGYRFVNYRFNPRDTTSLSKNQVVTLWEDRDGLIWVGTSEGICRFDPETETFTRLEKSAANPYAFKFTQSFAEDQQGNLWVTGGFAGELRLVDRKTGKFSATNYAKMLEADLRSNERMHLAYRDKSGTLWVGSPSGLHKLHVTPGSAGKLSRIDFTHFRHNPTDPNSLSNNYVTGIYEDRSGVLWVMTDGGVLHALDRQTGKFTRYPLNPARKLSLYRLLRTSMAEDREGNLWIGTFQDGLYKLDKNRNVITSYVHDPADPQSIIHNSIFALLVDRSGILWAASMGGVIKLDPNRKPFRVYRHNPAAPGSLSHNNIAAIWEDKQGTVWVGTAGGGLDRLNKQTGAFTHYRHEPEKPNSLRSDSVTAILEDRQGVLWVGNGKTLSRFDRQSGTFTHFPLRFPFVFNPASPPIFTIYEDRQGRLWLGTNNGILQYNRQTGKTINYPFDPDHPERIGDYWALALLEDQNGNLWIGPGSQALTRFNPKTGTFTQYKHDSHRPGSISSATVPTIYEDSRGDLWFGTGDGGLCQFNPATETFTTYSERQGLAGSSIFSILEDNTGNLWLGTNKGLARFSLDTHKFTNYSADEGLQGNMFTTLFTESAAFKGNDGTLYFGGNNGLTAFDPTQIRRNTQVPPIVITQFRLFDKLQPGKQEADRIELDYNQNFFSFEFAALNYTNPVKNQYAYQLVGLEKNWVYCGSRRYASYTNLAPGTYTFRVKGSNNDGVWNDKGALLTVVIHPAWWQTQWFTLLVGLALAGLLYGAYQYRLGQIRREQQLRDQISRDLHDDVGGILSGISFYSEAARQMHQQGRYSDSYALLLKIADNARSTIEHMSDVVWSMRSDTDNALKLAHRLENFGRELLSPLGIALVCQTDPDLARLKLAPDAIRNLYLVGKEALHNAAKYAEASEVCLRINQQGGKVNILVKDNGRGFDPATTPKGNGLENMQKRAEAIGATYTLSAQRGQGTVVSIEKIA